MERQILWSSPSLRRSKTRYSFRFLEISWNSYLNEWIDLIFEQVSQFCKKNYYFCIIALCYFLYHCTLLFGVNFVELGHSSISNKVKRPYWKIMYSFMSPMKMIRCWTQQILFCCAILALQFFWFFFFFWDQQKVQ